MFLLLHSEHGKLTPVLGRRTSNGHRFEVACACGAMTGRWLIPEEAAVELVMEQLQRRN
jgi:hypothetical protein